MPSFWSQFGSDAESAACRWLEASGYRILDRNWRRPWGELDIVASKADVVHFIEVKASVARTAGFEPFVRADRTKMSRVLRTARTWLACHPAKEEPEWQLDVISVIMNQDGPQFEHFEQIS